MSGLMLGLTTLLESFVQLCQLAFFVRPGVQNPNIFNVQQYKRENSHLTFEKREPANIFP